MPPKEIEEYIKGLIKSLENQRGITLTDSEKELFKTGYLLGFLDKEEFNGTTPIQYLN